MTILFIFLLSSYLLHLFLERYNQLAELLVSLHMTIFKVLWDLMIVYITIGQSLPFYNILDYLNYALRGG